MNRKGLALIEAVTRSPLKEKRQPVKDPFPLSMNDRYYLIGGVTLGVTEADLNLLVKRAAAYYDLTFKFHPADNMSEVDPEIISLGDRSECFSIETLLTLRGYLKPEDWKNFVSKDPRQEIMEIRERM